MSSDVLNPINQMLDGEESLEDFAERTDSRKGTNAENMYTGQHQGERFFVKSNLPEAEKAAHLAAAPLMEQFDHAPEIFYDSETEEIAISELGNNARSPNSATLSDSLYSHITPVDEDAFYKVAAERWMLGDANVYDNILVESVTPQDTISRNEREVYLHDFDHAGKNSSRGRQKDFKDAFEYVADKFGINFNNRRFKKEIYELGQDLDVEKYQQEVEELNSDIRKDLYEQVEQHSQVIADNIEYARTAFEKYEN